MPILIGTQMAKSSEHTAASFRSISIDEVVTAVSAQSNEPPEAIRKFVIEKLREQTKLVKRITSNKTLAKPTP
jgi:hypothetical protein